MSKLTCQMVDGCTAAVSHIDNKGYVYCAAHGVERRDWRPCRRMRRWEIRELEAGRPIHWKPTRKPVQP